MRHCPFVIGCRWEPSLLWDHPFCPDQAWLEEWLRLTRDETPYVFPQEVSILFTDNQTIQKYNAQYRGQDKPTNGLSFPSHSPQDIEVFAQNPIQDGPPIPIGDLLFAHETLQKEALDRGIPFESHLAHLVVHGMLHLLGYDHEQEDEADHMEALEVHILGKKGLPNPYESCMV